MIFHWFPIAFLAGSLPLALWTGFLFLKKDIRAYGDGNPGTTNVYRASGKRVIWFIIPFVFEITKAAVPVGLAHQIFGITGWPIVGIALMPVLGHAFSPFLGWRGGKAIAAGFGSLLALTGLFGLIAAVFVACFSYFIKPDAWALIVSMMGLLLLSLLFGRWEWTALIIGLIMIFVYTHRHDLKQKPGIKSMKDEV